MMARKYSDQDLTDRLVRPLKIAKKEEEEREREERERERATRSSRRPPFVLIIIITNNSFIGSFILTRKRNCNMLR
jgi:hypothetical protein